MAEVKVLVEGVHEKVDGKLKVGSTVSLIKSDKNIIVDTGSFASKDQITEGLKGENLTPDDIDLVILTHIHLDHVVNCNLFMNAQVICKFRGGGYPGQIHTPKEGCLERLEINDGLEISKDVSVILTPGHTPDMISVVVETDKGKVAIAGDAISSEEWADISKQPELVDDLDQYNNSRTKILKIADYIIPGHGKMFQVKK